MLKLISKNIFKAGRISVAENLSNITEKLIALKILCPFPLFVRELVLFCLFVRIFVREIVLFF